MNTTDSKSTTVGIVTHWRRFSTGLWRVPEGDIAAAYSADSFPKVATFIHEGRRYTNGGCAFSKWIHAEVNSYPLIVADEYRGPESVPYSHEGRKAIYKGQTFRLGAKTLFVASDPNIDEWRRLLRSLFADGGYFASGCDYPEFLTERCTPESEHGRVANAQELADCVAGRLPRTKEAMLEWLDDGVKSISLPDLQLGLNL